MKNNKIKLIDFEKAKNEIVREIAESKDFHNVVKHICYKNGFTGHTQIIEDIKQEVIYKLLKKEAEQIYEWYCDDPKRPFAVALGIAKNQFLKHPKLIGYNKHSFSEYISFTSNLKSQHQNDFDYYECEKFTFIPEFEETGNGEDVDNKDDEHVIYHLISFLSKEEQELIHYDLDKTKTKGKYTKEYRQKKADIFEKIKNIAEEKNIKIVF